ncbi:hypothetical protein BC936DRAFT_142056 [Jimgerdemannia flammicorona]|uniref:Uncharacterized protein n=2 Tax=Jimgerdemannia flammicorona TaxID=994334 RepID=A0A433DFK5_9FUNG|nr:hypothetical protein BC936DRAFT_142056 [Jimgerdemannia flammicorona]RUS25064.1 hypothetical protein BC938DRAFT_472681 [Jimgerdemannia flammicorona]
MKRVNSLLLELRANGDDLVNQILDGDDAEFAEGLFNNSVVGEGDALLVDLGVAALVDEFADGFEIGLTVGDVGFNELEHLLGSGGEANENAVVDLEQTE